MKKNLLLCFGTLALFGCTVKAEVPQKPERTILITIDGLASGIHERIDMPALSALIEEGVYYQEVYLPLPDHPRQSEDYPWSCSIPNPVLMSGTIFIGQPGIENYLIQHCFSERPTAFTVNSGSYTAIQDGFTIYRQLPKGEMTPVYTDELPIDAMKEIILRDNPEFMRIHCQGLGSSGSRTQAPGMPFTDNIWHPQSPWRLQAQHTDRVLGQFVHWLKTNDLWDSTVLMVMGDHGQADEGWHEPYSPASRTTQLVVAGKNVVKGRVYDYAEIIDIAPTIAWLHGIEPPKFGDGAALTEIVGEERGENGASKRTQYMRLLDEALSTHHQRYSGSMEDPELQIKMIGRWHEGPAGASYPEFVKRQAQKVFGTR